MSELSKYGKIYSSINLLIDFYNACNKDNWSETAELNSVSSAVVILDLRQAGNQGRKF